MEELKETSQSPQKKLNSLQAGRGIAALMVVLYHANGRYGFGDRHFLGHVFTFGFAGVDFFFVLSGFIIAYTSAHLIGQPDKTIYFLKKRFQRVYPIYWVYLLIALAAGFIQYHDPHIFNRFLNTFLLLPGHNTIIGPSWTLPFELTFYVLFGLLIFSRWALVIIIPMAVISVINAFLQNFGTYGVFHNHDLNDLCTPFNVEFLFGIFAWLIYDKINKATIFILLAMVAAAMVLEIMYFKRADYQEIYQGQRVLPFGLLAMAAVTAFAALDFKNMFNAPKILVYLGNASYTLYLIHSNIFSFVFDNIFVPMKLSENAVKDWMILVVCGTIALSFVLYEFVEKPLLRRVKGWRLADANT